MPKLALTFYSLLDIPIDDVVECYQAAETSGFEYGFMSESAGRDAMVILARAALATSSLKLGTNILPVFVRAPWQTAASALTLNEIADGRFHILGLGTSYKQRIETWFGESFEKPVLRTKEYVDVIRLLLSEGETNYAGQVFQMKEYPDLTALCTASRDIRIYLGVTGPMMRKLAGRVADGVILNSLSTPEFVRESIELIESGAENAGRSLSDVEIGCSIVFSASEDRNEAREAAKRALMFYIIYPEFDPIVKTTSLLPEVQRLREAYWSGDKKGAHELVTEEILDAFVVFGTPEECRQKLARYVDAGVQLLVIRSCVDKLNGKEAVLKNISALRNFGQGIPPALSDSPERSK